VFDNAIQHKLCWKGRYEHESGIVCSYKLNPVQWFAEQTIAFEIENAVYEKKIVNMFIPYKDAYVFEISEYNDYWNRMTNWEFGGRFLKSYTTTFDYNTKRITFYKEHFTVDANNLHMYVIHSINTSLLTNITLLITMIGIVCVAFTMKHHKIELEHNTQR
jgi:hypothetical protein